MKQKYSNIIGFDDTPFDRNETADVKIVGTIYAGLRFDGVLVGKVRKDGDDAARNIVDIIKTSRFNDHIQLVMLLGITMGGFNVVDILYIYEELGLPVLVLVRKQPDLHAIKDALLNHVSGGETKWELIEKAGVMEPVGEIYMQRVGLTKDQAGQTIQDFSKHGLIPEPLRTAHLIAGAITSGHSRGRC